VRYYPRYLYARCEVSSAIYTLDVRYVRFFKKNAPLIPKKDVTEPKARLL